MGIKDIDVNIPHALLPGYRFEVYFGNNNRFGFTNISGLKLALAYEPLHVGGKNDGPVMLRAPVKEHGKLTMERGKYFASPRSAYFFSFQPGQRLAEHMTIEIKDDYGKRRAVYHVHHPVLESIELTGLDAKSSAPLIEKLTILHQGISY